MKSPRFSQHIWAGVLASIAVLLTARSILTFESAAPEKSHGTNQMLASTLNHRTRDNRSALVDPRLTLAILEPVENAYYNGTGRNIFQLEKEPQPAKDPILPDKSPTPEKVSSPSPAIGLRFFGYALEKNFPLQVFLRDGDSLFIAKKGDIVDRRYRVMKIGSDSVDVEDLAENSVHTLTLPAMSDVF